MNRAGSEDCQFLGQEAGQDGRKVESRREAAAFDALMQAFDTIEAPEGTKARFKAEVRRFAGQRLYVPKNKTAERIVYAVRLLELAHRPQEVQHRLMQAFSVSRETARKDVTAALDTRHRRATQQRAE